MSRQAAYQARLTQQIREYKEAHACTDCYQHFPHYIMEFDHVKADKKRDIGSVRSKPAFYYELTLCELVCANCHKTRTWFRSKAA